MYNSVNVMYGSSQRMGMLWRLAKVWRLPWIVAVLFTVGFILVYVAPPDNYIKRNSLLRRADHESMPVMSKKQGIETIGVRKQLSQGAYEEENAADEEFEGAFTKSDRNLHDLVVEDNAAKEVHSNEIEGFIHQLSKQDKIDEDKQLEEIENSFHQLPLQQASDKEEQNILASSTDIYHHKLSLADLEERKKLNWRNLSNSEIKSLSIMGRRLFLHENIGSPKSKTFTILVWKHGLAIERRLLKSYGRTKLDPFAQCSVNNCKLSYKDDDINVADAVLFHLHKLSGPPIDVPRASTAQRWVWLTDESPYNTFMIAKDKNLSHYNGYFNWSMNYRMDSDVPVPYGRTVPLPVNKINKFDYKNIFDTKNQTIAVMGSNCHGVNKRWDYIKHLNKYIHVDTYGRCGNLPCPGHFTKDCTKLNNYLFYLGFENSNCKEYITEKPWWNAIGKFSVPIVMGTARKDYEKLLPPNSFIYAEDFKTPKALAEYIKYLADNKDEYNKYHEWRLHYEARNEHGYFGSSVYHYCRLCEALNYNSPEHHTYNNLQQIWNKDIFCYPPKWTEFLNPKSK